MRHHLTPIRTAMIMKQNFGAGEDAERGEPRVADGGNVQWGSHVGKQYGGSSKY